MRRRPARFCGEQDTDVHRAFGCEAVLASEHPDIVKSNWLAVEARAGATGWPCLWLRGLLPLGLLKPEPHPEEAHIWSLCREAHRGGLVPLHGRTVYLDESAGEYSSNPYLRRAGWGLAVLDHNLKLEFAWYGTVAGKWQTQNRAAIEALIFLTKHTEGDIIIAPDSLFLLNGAAGAESKDPSEKHYDLWHEFVLAKQLRRGALAYRKVSAHQSMQDFAEGSGPLEDWLGNHMADRLADKGAQANRVGINMERQHHHWLMRANLVQKRLLAVQKKYMEAMGSVRKATRIVQDPAWVRALKASGHQLYWQKRKGATCRKCHQSMPAKKLKQWIKDSCCNPTATWSAGLERPQGSFQVAGHELDSSHALLSYRGIVFCGACGGYATTMGQVTGRPKTLRAPCRGATSTGTRALKRIKKGLPPESGREWPEPAVEGVDIPHFTIRGKIIDPR